MLPDNNFYFNKKLIKIITGIAQSVRQLAAGWKTKRLKFKNRQGKEF
jgi:hypothetical protein